jgi:hypothetical protein
MESTLTLILFLFLSKDILYSLQANCHEAERIYRLKSKNNECSAESGITLNLKSFIFIVRN